MVKGRTEISINRRLLCGFGIAAVIFFALAIVTETRLATLAELRRIQREEIFPRVAAAEDLEGSAYSMGVAARKFALSRDERYRKVFEIASSQFRAGADRLSPLLTRESSPALRDVKARGEAYERAARGLFAAGPASPEKHVRADVAMAEARHAVFVPVRDYLAEQRARSAQLQDQIGDAVTQMSRAGLILAPLALAAMTVSGVWTSRRVRRSLEALVAEGRALRRTS